jgi:hypothetical protein
MELNKIKKILKKYNSGISNLEEECLLKEFFKKNDVPKDLIHYKLIFNYLDYANDYNFNKKVIYNKFNSTFLKFSIAASIILFLSSFIYLINSETNFYASNMNEISSYEKTKSAFELLSNKFNQSKSKIYILDELSQSLSIGQQNINHLKNFNLTTKRLIK